MITMKLKILTPLIILTLLVSLGSAACSGSTCSTSSSTCSTSCSANFAVTDSAGKTQTMTCGSYCSMTLKPGNYIFKDKSGSGFNIWYWSFKDGNGRQKAYSRAQNTAYTLSKGNYIVVLSVGKCTNGKDCCWCKTPKTVRVTVK